MGRYDDILDLPHHVSGMRHRMSMQERAAQFQAFKALAGHEEAVRETERAAAERADRVETEDFPGA